jgi:hypothetical protein
LQAKISKNKNDFDFILVLTKSVGPMSLPPVVNCDDKFKVMFVKKRELRV